MTDLMDPGLPEDAGEYADGLTAILARIPKRWGKWIQVDRGWYQLIIELDQQIAAIDPGYEVHQVKEKFGGLRYYCSVDGMDKVKDLIRAAEAKAAETCEVCSMKGRLCVRRGWYKTLCGPDAEARGYTE